MGKVVRSLISLRGFVTVTSLVISVFSLACGIQLLIYLPRSPLGLVATFIGTIIVLNTGYQWRWPWRFSLRTLFIVTTLLAVVLGLIAWLDRAWIGK